MLNLEGSSPENAIFRVFIHLNHPGSTKRIFKVTFLKKPSRVTLTIRTST